MQEEQRMNIWLRNKGKKKYDEKNNITTEPQNKEYTKEN